MGEGTFGVVYRGCDTLLQTPIAVKIIRKLPHSQRAEEHRYLQILSQISHPNICEYYTSCEKENRIYIIMKLYKESLFERIYDTSRGRLSEEECVRIFEQLLSGMIAIHSKGTYLR